MRFRIRERKVIEATLQMRRPVPFTGRVRVPKRKKIKCEVYALPSDPESLPPPLGLAYKRSIRRDGSFSFNSQLPGRYVLITVADGWARSTVEVDTTNGSVRGISVPLDRGQEITLVTDRKELDAVFIQIESADGVPIYATTLAADKSRKVRLVAGEYRVRARPIEGKWTEQPLMVGHTSTTVRIP